MYIMLSLYIGILLVYYLPEVELCKVSLVFINTVNTVLIDQ